METYEEGGPALKRSLLEPPTLHSSTNFGVYILHVIILYNSSLQPSNFIVKIPSLAQHLPRMSTMDLL